MSAIYHIPQIATDTGLSSYRTTNSEGVYWEKMPQVKRCPYIASIIDRPPAGAI